jgi:hypothetical protein
MFENSPLLKTIAVTTIVVTAVTVSLGIYENIRQTNDKSNSTKTPTTNTQTSATPNLDNLVNSTDTTDTNSTKKDYVVKTIDSTKTSNNLSQALLDSAKIKKQRALSEKYKEPTIYGGVVVNELKKFSNAKLIGIYQEHIAFLYSKNIMDFFANGLLFELNNEKILNLIGPNQPFYIGQRYDISYHTFKEDISVKGDNILQMYISSEDKLNTIMNTNYAINYDGAIVDCKLIKKNK